MTFMGHFLEAGNVAVGRVAVLASLSQQKESEDRQLSSPQTASVLAISLLLFYDYAMAEPSLVTKTQDRLPARARSNLGSPLGERLRQFGINVPSSRNLEGVVRSLYFVKRCPVAKLATDGPQEFRRCQRIARTLEEQHGHVHFGEVLRPVSRGLTVRVQRETEADDALDSGKRRLRSRQ